MSNEDIRDFTHRLWERIFDLTQSYRHMVDALVRSVIQAEYLTPNMDESLLTMVVLRALSMMSRHLYRGWFKPDANLRYDIDDIIIAVRQSETYATEYRSSDNTLVGTAYKSTNATEMLL
jgi:hypothetical protein